MTDTISRWLGIATINFMIAAPSFALEENFGDESSNTSAITTTVTSDAAQASTTEVTADQTSTAAPAAAVADIDDPLTLNALRHIRLKNLTVDATATQPDSVKDPFQPLNRKVFKFNSKVDQYVLLPVAKTYKNHVPNIVRSSVGRFFSNLREPWNAVNHLLQGNPKSSYKSLGRFTVNTVTSLGLADPATQLGITSTGEDFGQTLGVWGVKSGPFLMLPFIGPSTMRDTGGMAVDMFARPQRYLDETSIYWGLSSTEIVNMRAGLIGVEDLVQGDQYSLLRDLYLQRRQYLISGQTDVSSAIDNSFGDEDDSFEESPAASEAPDQPTDTPLPTSKLATEPSF
jgi:phospholipid-binding lipoprotein MlaA